MESLFFYLGLSMLMTHELDAIAQSEWRLLFVLRKLPEPTAAAVFIGAHVPAIAAILWLTHTTLSPIQFWARLGIAMFLMIHMLLHQSLDRHPLYSFHSLLSKSLIYGGGLCGLLYCILVVLSLLG